MAKLAVVRIRGSVRGMKDADETMRMLGITRIHHCVVVDDTPSVKGMLQKAKDYISWGEIKPDVLEHLLRKRGRLVGDKKLDESVVKASGFSSIKDFAEAIFSGKAKISSVSGLKKVFRLSPPSGGFKSTKRAFKDLGDLGYRGELINNLLMRMA